ncbi:sugar ABC transporter ATP-binding protein [Microbacterium sp. RD1]|uniref:sugar ABC transporter ATP-binding protein n=1 Tax=Microbacterium sp. RD1 TaxID=3457313 RepID=UPI003FA55E44
MTTQSPRVDGDVIARTVGVTQEYPGVVALADVDFELRRGEVRALLGQNGAGKSTLIRLLSGVEVPTSGEVLIAGTPLGSGGVREATDRGVSTCYQELSLVADMTVAENFFLGRWPRARVGIDVPGMARRAREVLSGLGLDIDPDALAGSLTLAQQQIVEIARALENDPALLILDEPTSALATAEVELVLAAVRRVADSGVAVLYVSHRMDEIRQIAHSATVMRNGRVVETVDIREYSTAAIVRLMIGSDPESQRPDAAESAAGPVRLAVTRLTAEPKLRDVSFSARGGEILGIAGLLGSGRTELLRAVAGFDAFSAGAIEIDGKPVRAVRAETMRRRGVALTPEDRKREGALMNLGIDENIVMSDYRAVSRRGALSQARIREASGRLAERLRIKADDLSRPISTLSGGNQQKAVIARWLHADAGVLLLDEPTRGVDVEAKAQIYAIMRAVADAGKAVIFVSSELEELPLCCDRVLVLRDGTIQREFTGGQIVLSELLEAAMSSSPVQEES